MAARNTTVDIAKGLGIILVVLGHSWLVQRDHGTLYRVIFSFHVPLFFFLSGVFLKDSGKLKDFALARLDSLVKPYLVVLTIMGVVLVTRGDALPVPYFSRMIYGSGILLAWPPIWFLPHLFAVLCIAWLLLRCVRRTKNPALWTAVIACVLLVIGSKYADAFWLSSRHHWQASVAPVKQALDIQNIAFGLPKRFFGLPGLPLSLDIAYLSTAFILLGHLAAKPIQSIRFRGGVFAAALVAFALLHLFFPQVVDLNMRQYPNVLVASLKAAAGIYLTVSLSALFSCSPAVQRPLAYVGAGSLFILIFHFPVQSYAYGVIKDAGASEDGASLLSTATGIVVPLLFWEIAKRVRPLALCLLPWKREPVRKEEPVPVFAEG